MHIIYVIVTKSDMTNFVIIRDTIPTYTKYDTCVH